MIKRLSLILSFLALCAFVGLPSAAPPFVPQPHGTATYTTSGTHTVAANVHSITAKLIGASGGGGDDSITRGGSGSGGGAECIKLLSVTPGQVITFVVGLHGNGGVAAARGTSGGDSTIAASGLTAGGSQGGQRNAAGGTGGTASGCDTNTSGTNGSVNVGGAGGAGGAAAAPDGGSGGAGGGTNQQGFQGNAPGGGTGGNGSGVVQNGADGLDGAVIFVW